MRRSEPQTRLGVGASDEGKVFRVEITGYLNYSKYPKSNKVLYVPLAKLSEQFQRIHQEGGKIASITPTP
ncbi:MAG: photosystem I reaction center subunit XII, partial [Synechococcus sp. SB0672_bin_10]|nr:photosystem I reaction center subunit XII [Synechococcus sp. SB0672_bin_10]